MLKLNPLKLSAEDEAKKQEVMKLLREKYKDYKDPWGFDLDTIEKAINLLLPFYRNYFKVRVFGAENVKDKTYMLVSNHTGQVPIDGMLITLALAFDVHPPRILRSMIERFMAGLPFIGELTAEAGSILGDRQNSQYLLQNGQSILVFPEGVRGISKNTTDFYKMQKFSNGFLRIALQEHTPILPITVVGAEEMFPFVFHAKNLARLLKFPALPLTANFFPLPSPIDIYIGEEYELPTDLSAEAQDKDIREHVYRIETIIKNQLAKGLKNRRPFFEDVRNPIKRFIRKRS